MKHCTFHAPIYGHQIQIHPNFKSLSKYVSMHEGSASTAACVDVCETKDGITFFAMTFRGTDFMTPDTIAHECLHLSWRILQAVGSKATANNHEHLAYLLGFMVEQVTKYTDAYKASVKTKSKNKGKKNGKPTQKN